MPSHLPSIRFAKIYPFNAPNLSNDGAIENVITDNSWSKNLNSDNFSERFRRRCSSAFANGHPCETRTVRPDSRGGPVRIEADGIRPRVSGLRPAAPPMWRSPDPDGHRPAPSISREPRPAGWAMIPKRATRPARGPFHPGGPRGDHPPMAVRRARRDGRRPAVGVARPRGTPATGSGPARVRTPGRLRRSARIRPHPRRGRAGSRAHLPPGRSEGRRAGDVRPREYGRCRRWLPCRRALHRRSDVVSYRRRPPSVPTSSDLRENPRGRAGRGSPDPPASRFPFHATRRGRRVTTTTAPIPWPRA